MVTLEVGVGRGRWLWKVVKVKSNAAHWNDEAQVRRWAFLYAVRMVCAFDRFDDGSHEFSEVGYPSHLIRYWRRDPFPRCASIASTSNSSSPSIRSGGGSLWGSPYASVV